MHCPLALGEADMLATWRLCDGEGMRMEERWWRWARRAKGETCHFWLGWCGGDADDERFDA